MNVLAAALATLTPNARNLLLSDVVVVAYSDGTDAGALVLDVTSDGCVDLAVTAEDDEVKLVLSPDEAETLALALMRKVAEVRLLAAAGVLTD
jgi:hypothetical protein